MEKQSLGKITVEYVMAKPVYKRKQISDSFLRETGMSFKAVSAMIFYKIR